MASPQLRGRDYIGSTAARLPLLARVLFWTVALAFGLVWGGMVGIGADGCIDQAIEAGDTVPAVIGNIPQGALVTNVQTSTATAWDGGTANVTISWGGSGSASAFYVGSTGDNWENIVAATTSDGFFTYNYDGAPTVGSTSFHICYVSPSVVTSGGDGGSTVDALAVISEQLHGLSAFLFIASVFVLLPSWVSAGLLWWRRG